MNIDGKMLGRTSQIAMKHAIIYSGRRDGRHHEEVAIILSKAAAKSLIKYHPVSERMIRARLKTKPIETKHTSLLPYK